MGEKRILSSFEIERLKWFESLRSLPHEKRERILQKLAPELVEKPVSEDHPRRSGKKRGRAK